MALVSEDILRGIRQLRELEDRFLNGTLDPRLTRKPLQAILEKRTPMSINSHRLEVERQLAVLTESYNVTIDDATRECLIAQAESFVSLSDTDTPLITGAFGQLVEGRSVRDQMNGLFGLFDPAKPHYKENNVRDYEIRRTPGFGVVVTGIRLIHFDPNAYHGLSPEDAVKAAKDDKGRLGGLEVLEKLLLDPEYGFDWNGSDHPYPNISGLQLKYDGNWSNVPCLLSWGRSARHRFGLSSFLVDTAYDEYSSPAVREC